MDHLLHETNKFIIVKLLNYLFPHKFQRFETEDLKKNIFYYPMMRILSTNKFKGYSTFLLA